MNGFEWFGHAQLSQVLSFLFCTFFQAVLWLYASEQNKKVMVWPNIYCTLLGHPLISINFCPHNHEALFMIISWPSLFLVHLFDLGSWQPSTQPCMCFYAVPELFWPLIAGQPSKRIWGTHLQASVGTLSQCSPWKRYTTKLNSKLQYMNLKSIISSCC